MKDLLKMMFIPLVGVIAIGMIFLFVIYGGRWDDDVYNEEGTRGLATLDLQAYDAVVMFRGECDPGTNRPACGVDGISYDNACYAYKAGVKVAHLGACGPR